MRVVICGGGVIGACTAYFLSRRGVTVTVVERAEIAAAASGKAGGFLALDWCGGTPLDGLARRSFQLHAELSRDFAGDWSYQRTTTYAGVARTAGARRGGGRTLDWLTPNVVLTERLGTTATTATVTPRRFTTGMMNAALALGAELRRGTITALVRREDDSTVRGVEVEGTMIEADAVVIALGPWSLLAAEWARLPAVFGRRSPSLVYDLGAKVSAEALFLDCHEEDGDVVPIEVFPRSDGSILVTAFSDFAPLPIDPNAVVPTADEVRRLRTICERMSSLFTAEKIIAQQACFRPMTEDGLPLIGKVPESQGAYVATGHSAWGILNAPATGEALAELIVDGTTTVDLTPFDPSRLRPFILEQSGFSDDRDTGHLLRAVCGP
jgi:glycine/D-amino acid oxidase-like deaminating enzyme